MVSESLARRFYDKDRRRRYYEKHKNDPAWRARVNAKAREWKKRNKDKAKAIHAREYAKNKAAYLSRNAAYYRNNRMSILAHQKERYAQTPEVRERALLAAQRRKERLRVDPELRAKDNAKARAAARRCREELSGGYMNNILQQRGWKKSDITPEIVGVVKEVVRLKREIRKCR